MKTLNHSLSIKKRKMELYSQRCEQIISERSSANAKIKLLELNIQASQSLEERQQYRKELTTLNLRLKDIEHRKAILEQECELEAIESLSKR